MKAIVGVLCSCLVALLASLFYLDGKSWILAQVSGVALQQPHANANGVQLIGTAVGGSLHYINATKEVAQVVGTADGGGLQHINATKNVAQLIGTAVGGGLQHINATMNVTNMFGANNSAGWKAGNCSFALEPACQEWCLKPAWTKQIHTATRLSCCKPDDALPTQTNGLRSQTKNSENVEPPKVTVALLYTNEIKMLRRHLQNWIQFSPEVLQQIRFLIAAEMQIPTGDTPPWDIIQEELQKLGPKSKWPRVDILGVQEHLNFNIGGKRNLLVHIAEQPTSAWIFLTDIDMMFDDALLSQALAIANTAKSDEVIHKFNRKKPSGKMLWHPGTWLMRSELYWRAGGCDEDFVGTYGMTDIHFDARAGWSGIRTKFHPDLILHELDHEKSGKRSVRRNEKLMRNKTKHGSWSNHFLRFNFGWISCAVGSRSVR